MKQLLIAAVCAGALALAGASTSSAAGGGIKCGGNTATDKAGNFAHFQVKTFDVGCNRADKGVKRYYRQTNGEQGKVLEIQGYICGPLQPFKRGAFAFQCRSHKSPAKRYKAIWDSHS